jgi:hypothetical protein
MSPALTLLTLVHVAISLAGIASGFVVLYGFLVSPRLSRWTGTFLATTVATSVTGFLFPVDHVTPGHVIGVLSLIVLGVALYALHAGHLTGVWNAAFVVSSVVSQYLNFFVLVVQLFMKVAVLRELAPTQSELPFVATQLLVLATFVALGVVAVRQFGGRPRPIHG